MTLNTHNSILKTRTIHTAVSISPQNLADCQPLIKLINTHLSAIDFVEWRLDAWQVPTDLLTAAQLIAQIDRPLILTNRTRYDGGQFNGNLAAYRTLYETLIKHQIGQVIDLEWHIPLAVRQDLGQLAQTNGYQVILSQHDLVATQPTVILQQTLAAMAAEPAIDIVKLATTAQTKNDTMRLLDVTRHFTEQDSHPLITMAMSELGQASRILGGQFGSCLTFGYLETPSAPGQLPIDQLKSLL